LVAKRAARAAIISSKLGFEVGGSRLQKRGRAIDDTAAFGLRIKAHKTERSKRTITVDDDLIALLLAARERQLRIAAGVPDGARSTCHW
jgi:hypothetical protein